MSGTGLSAKAKPFVFNPTASSFNPGASFKAPTPAPAPSTAPTAVSISEAPTETFDLATDAHPTTAPAANSSDSWEDIAEEKSQATQPIPAPAPRPAATPSPPPPASDATDPASSSPPPTSQSLSPPPTSASVDDLSAGTAALALDDEEAKILEEAAAEEAEESVKKVKKLDTDRVAHDDREHINIVFIGHVDAGKCFVRGTRLRLFDGQLIAVEHVLPGMQLMGDDGQPRTVTAGSLTQGRSALYRIEPKWTGASPFTVNGAHILVLVNNCRPFLQYCEKKGTWRLIWWLLTADNRMEQTSCSFHRKADGKAALAAALAGWAPLLWEVSVDDYRNAGRNSREISKLIACKAITFNNPLLPSLSHVLSLALDGAAPSDAQLEYMAWWLGMWVTDGVSERASISQGGPPAIDAKGVHHADSHDEVVARLHEYAALFNAPPIMPRFDQESTAGWDAWYDYGADSVAGRVLRLYGLLKNKHIPRALICDSVKVRQRVLAGIIDGDGWYCREKNYYELCAKDRHVIDGYKELAATLGLRNSNIAPKTSKDKKTGKEYSGHRILFSGDMWDVVQHCALTYKQCPQPGATDYVEKQFDSRCYGFSITAVAADDYFGFAVHGGSNRRFLLEDYTITHNSTISGQILLLTDQVDERTMAKYEKEAKEKNRESWYLAYIMDTNEEERARGKTVEVGRAHFSTAKKRYTLLDAPGHKNYVPNMIGGASQADVGVLVISARKGEFEAGFDRGGQTREHAMLAKTLGLQKLVVLINKMDEKEVAWRQERYDQIRNALEPFIKKCGFNTKTDVVFIPASGYTGANIKEPVSKAVCSWYHAPSVPNAGKSLFQVLDDFPPMQRDPLGALRLPIMARYKDMGALFCLGKLESGTLYRDRKLLMMPNKVEVLCTGIVVEDTEVDMAKPGENVLVKVKGIEEEDVQEGYVLSYLDRPTKRAVLFEATVAVLELLEHKPIMAVGYEAMLHVHVLTCECVLSSIVQGIDKKTGEKMDKKPRFLKSNDFATVRFRLTQSAAIETFKLHPALGRFTIRDEGKTIAIGKVTQIKEIE